MLTFAAIETPNGTELEGSVRYGDFAHLEMEKIEFRIGKSDQWNRIREAKRQDIPQGHFFVRWNPKDYGVPQNAQLHYAVRLHDKLLHLAYTHRMRHTFWNRAQRTQEEQALFVALVALATYSTVLAGLCYFATPTAWKLAKHLVGEENNRFRDALFALSGLSVPLSQTRLRLKWLDAYRSEKTTWESLPMSLQDLYAEDARCLGAWVDRHSGVFWMKACQTFEGVRQNPFAPISLCDPINGRIRLANPAEIAPCFDGSQPFLALVGGAGVGKSTLAYQIAKWAYQEEKTECLWRHSALPLVLEGDFEDLFIALLESLQRLASQQVVRPEFLKSLAQHRRILVILEDFSQRSTTTQASVYRFLGEGQNIPILITSAAPLNLPCGTVLAPCFPDLNAIANFVCQYAQNTLPERDDQRVAEALAALLREKPSAEAWTAQEIVQFMEKQIGVN
jgi:hypothetical protein